MFLDEAIVTFSSGRGGAGSASFHREKHVPRGGPNGADGGKGGDIVLIADRNKRTLYDFQLNTHFDAQSGIDAIGSKDGKDAPSIEIKVPVGTVVYDQETGDAVADLSFDGMRVTLLKGGRGGFGNLHYTNSVRQAPTMAQRGAPGDILEARLELKLLADIGLIGLPNAGKSTLISGISAAKPKIADYPFTTIVPNLGVVSIDEASFTVADMPGLIEGAAEGKGLGHRFLKHVERTSVLVHVVEVAPIDQSDPVRNFELVEAELASYDAKLAERPRIVALSKIDAVDADTVELELERLSQVVPEGTRILPISAVSGAGIEVLLREMKTQLESAPSIEPITITVPSRDLKESGQWEVIETNAGYEVLGRRVVRLVAMTNLDSDESLQHLQRLLERIGVFAKLAELGAQEGETVRIGAFEFAYEPD